MEHVLEAARDEIRLLLANLERERQVAQQSAELEAGRLADATRATAKEARRFKAMAAYGSGLPFSDGRDMWTSGLVHRVTVATVSPSMTATHAPIAP